MRTPLARQPDAAQKFGGVASRIVDTDPEPAETTTPGIIINAPAAQATARGHTPGIVWVDKEGRIQHSEPLQYGPPSSRVYLLGAGFSRSISTDDLVQPNEMMPLLADLSAAVIHHLDSRHKPAIPYADTLLANDFERWLSFLVETPPWLSDSDLARNMAAFLDITLAVHWELRHFQWLTVFRQHLDAIQNGGVGCPWWLQRLVMLWERENATVITFNYDQLVELAWNTFANPGEGHRTTALYRAPLTPIRTRVGEFDPTTRADLSPPGLHLLKLHGSLGWYYSGISSPPSEPVYDAPLTHAEWNEDGLAELAHFHVSAVGLDPMIVPPAAVKSPYYGNKILRGQWRAAGEALSQATELVIMGFSLPPTDMLVGSMLSTQVNAKCRIIPVDYGDGILSRLRSLFGVTDDDPRIDTTFVGHGASAIPRWVEAMTGAK